MQNLGHVTFFAISHTIKKRKENMWQLLSPIKKIRQIEMVNCNFCHADLSDFDSENRVNHEKSCHKANSYVKNLYGQWQCLKCTKFMSNRTEAFEHVKNHNQPYSTCAF